jgi:hypothetical protein
MNIAVVLSNNRRTQCPAQVIQFIKKKKKKAKINLSKYDQQTKYSTKKKNAFHKEDNHKSSNTAHLCLQNYPVI